MLMVLKRRKRIQISASSAFITPSLRLLDLLESLLITKRELLEESESAQSTLRPRLETITKRSNKPLTSNKDKPKGSSKLRLEMTTTGSQMRISTVSYTTQTPFKSSKVKIAKLKLPSSMMTSPDKFASRSLKPSRPSPPKNWLKL
jgi:hypothetical protein